MRSFAVAGVGMALVAAGVGLPAASAQGAVAPSSGSTLSWAACPATLLPKGAPPLQCSSVQVPVDHTRPASGSIALALYRAALPAGQARPAKVLFVNAGGPGGEASLLTSIASTTYPAAVRARYDVIGVDPRGMGRSAPVSCLDPTQITSIAPTPNQIVLNQLQRRDLALSAAGYVSACARTSGPLLPYLNTDQTARDFDDVRASLGVPTAAFVGYSYGTLLFSRYASLFPTHVERLVLDSAVDPTTWGLEFFKQRAITFEARLGDFAAWAAGYDPELHLGATPAAVLTSFDTIVADLTSAPLVAEEAALGAGDVQNLVSGAMYSSSTWPDTGSLLSQVQSVLNGDVPATSGASAAVGSAQAMRTALPTPAPDNQSAALFGVLCNEGSFPTGTRPVFTRLDRLRERAPRIGAIELLTALPCSTWPAAARTDAGPTRGIKDVPGPTPLVVQAVKDPVTPYPQGLAMTQLVGAGLLTVTGGDHTHFGLGAEPCTDAVVGRYLLTGAQPARGTVCAGAPLPKVTATPAAGGEGTGSATPGTTGPSERQRVITKAREQLRHAL